MRAVPDNLRRTILDASLGLIASEGLEGFSMREVARRAGVSHQAPYHHFPDRESIMAAIVAEGFTRLRDVSLAALDGLSDPFARLSAVGRAYIQFALDNPAHFTLMFRSEHVREEKHDEAAACAQGAFDVLVQIADEVATHSHHNTRTIILTAWSTVHGVATLMLEGKLDKAIGDEGTREAAADHVIASLEKMLRASA